MTRRLLAVSALLVVAVLAVLGVSAGPASAAPYPPSTQVPVITASAYDPCAGASNIIGGANFQPGETIVLDLLKTGVIGTVVVGADGTFTTTVTVPLEARGSDQVIARGLTSGRSAQLTLEIPCVLDPSGGGSDGNASGFDAGSGALASTGAAVGAAVVLGVVLAGVGSVLTVAGRRRHGRSTAR